MVDDSYLKCSSCHCEKPDCEFGVCSATKSGKRSQCKACCRAYQEQYKQTARGWAIKSWHNIEDRVENRSGKDKSYENVRNLFTQDQFLAWAVPAYEAFRSQYPSDVASVDRINPDGNYEKGNVRVLPWRENTRLARRKLARRYKAHMGLVWRKGKREKTLSVDELLQVSPVLVSPNKFAQRLKKVVPSPKPAFVSPVNIDKFYWEL